MNRYITAIAAAGAVAMTAVAVPTSADARIRGPGIAAGVIGLATGAIVGSALAGNGAYGYGYGPAYGYDDYAYGPAYGSYGPEYGYGYGADYDAGYARSSPGYASGPNALHYRAGHRRPTSDIANRDRMSQGSL